MLGQNQLERRLRVGEGIGRMERGEKIAGEIRAALGCLGQGV